MKRLVLALIAAFAMAQTAFATPLTLSYTVSGTGTYLYSFTLTLDNHDNSWSAGQGFNWIIFGDKPGIDFSGVSAFTTGFTFDADTGTSAGLDYTNTVGGHNGPSLIDYSDPFGAGWTPSALGDSLMWTGTSTTLLGANQLLWSNIAGLNSVSANFEVAQLNASALMPEPATLGLFGISLLGLGVAGRRKY